MPGKHVIKISGDFVEVTQGFKRLSDTIGTLSSKKHSVKFDTSFLKTLSNDIKQHQQQLTERSQRLADIMQRAYKQLQTSYEKATDPERIAQLERRFQRLNKEFSTTTQQATTMSQMRGPGIMSRVGAGVAGAARFGLAVGGMYMGAYGLGGARREIAPAGLQLRGMGVAQSEAQMKELRGRGARWGFGAAETLQQAQALAAAGGADAVQGRIGKETGLEVFQRMQRATGIGAQELTGMVGGLRRGGMEGPQSLRKLQDMYTQAIAAGFDKSRAVEYMQTQTEYIQQMSASSDVNAGALSKFLGTITAGRGFFTANAQRVAEARTGIERGWGAQQGFGSAAAYRTIMKLMPGGSPAERLLMKKTGFFERGGMAEKFGQGGVQTLFSEIGKMSGVEFKSAKKGTDEFKMLQMAVMENFGYSATMAEQMIEAVQEGTYTYEEFADKTEKAKADLEQAGATNMQNLDGSIAKSEAAIENTMVGIGDQTNKVTTMFGGWGHAAMEGLTLVSGGVTALGSLKYLLNIGKEAGKAGQAASVLSKMNLGGLFASLGSIFTTLGAVGLAAGAGWAIGTAINKAGFEQWGYKKQEEWGLGGSPEASMAGGAEAAKQSVAQRLMSQYGGSATAAASALEARNVTSPEAIAFNQEMVVYLRKIAEESEKAGKARGAEPKAVRNRLPETHSTVGGRQ